MQMTVSAVCAALAAAGLTYGLWELRGREVAEPKHEEKAVLAAPTVPAQAVTQPMAGKNNPNISAGGNVSIGHLGDNIIQQAPTRREPENAGLLTPKNLLVFSPNSQSRLRLEIGDSGVFFEEQDQYGQVAFPFLRRDQFKVELVDGEYKFSTKITERNGVVIAEIIQNEWLIAPAGGALDRNYDDHALEVKDSRGNIVLQVQVFSNVIKLQGIWWTDKSIWPEFTRISVFTERVADIGFQGIRVTNMAMIGRMGENESQQSPIRPLFRYPSLRHLGERAN
jgi:hypothetical protein